MADSLAAIKKLVFEEKKITPIQLWNAILDDFQSDENKKIQAMLIDEVPKYGNDIDEVDQLVVDVYNVYIDEMKKYPNTRYGRGPIGGIRYAGTSSISANVGQGYGTMATPDGRKAHTPLAEGCSPAHAMDKKGPTAVFKSVSKLPTHEITGGVLLNQKVTPQLLSKEENKEKMEKAIRAEKLKKEVIDVTLPAKKNCVGHRHPNTIALEEVERVFTGMGYEVVEGPEIEYDEYNFRKLNIPDGHPAKDEQDTFYINDKVVLRTQTSPVQARVMEKGRLPIRMISPGRVYRADEVDATHSPCFHQVEGLYVDKNVNFTDLKQVLLTFAREMFGPDTKIRLRPSYFPFTEPSAEMDISCHICGGKGCGFCKHTGWVEILGCGMVDPNVLEACGIDSKVYSGYAFGMGVERITNLKYRVSDLRMFSENDTRFLKEFESAY